MRADLLLELREVANEGANYGGVVLRTAASNDQVDRFLAAHSLPILTVLTHGVEAVNYCEYASGEGNVFPAQPVGIAVAVPALVMMSNDRNDRIRKFDAAEDLSARDRMNLHLF